MVVSPTFVRRLFGIPELIVDLLLVIFIIYKRLVMSIFLYIIIGIHLVIFCLLLYIPYALGVYFQDIKNMWAIILIIIYLHLIAVWRRKLKVNITKGG